MKGQRMSELPGTVEVCSLKLDSEGLVGLKD